MKPLLLLAIPGTLLTGVLILTGIVVLYSVAKAIMRYLDKNK
jgi:hypothetical protein